MVKLKDLSSFAQRKVNLVGLVVEFSVPRRTNGTGGVLSSVFIIDQSQQTPEVTVNVFMRNIDGLPHLRSQKDIILLCSFKVEFYNQNYTAVYDHKASSFALFDGRITNDFTPYQVSPSFYSLHSDKHFVRRMRNWSQITPFDAGTSDYAVLLKDIKGHEFIDLVCMVLHLCEISNDNWMLFVWDGTDAPALHLEKEVGADKLPLQLEQTGLPPSVLNNFPRLGTVLRVMIDEKYENFGNHFKIVRDWVRIRNLHCRTVSGLWEGVLTPQTKIRHLSRNDNSVVGHLRDYKERIARQGCLPSCISPTSNFLTEVPNFEQARCTTLMELLTSPLVRGMFKCVVRFLAVLPAEVECFRSPTGSYRMRITLEDPTARIRALLQSGDADEFFGDELDIDALAVKMNRLLGMSESDNTWRNPPWSVCCIGFHSSNENDLWGSRHFHICNTRLVP
ncbi:unnamed protein product [Coffea canephora]|uniref:Protection of telomeres protein 1 n=1 Tax=Coffea canephora TaxID=49390 RepID=A0A068VAN0_COFCA|nr:unnamed protein product [Coffea canephora]